MADLLNKVGEILPKELGTTQLKVGETKSEASFADLLKNSLEETNLLQEEGEKAVTDIATGAVKDLHQAAIALGKAESSLKLMLEIRNKALTAYREITRMQM
ncbi:MAG: flagellar hook-basal body complex protein FliE [Helicobacteraceae bacterium]|jgi:flagellar hook-basal body complex protein FliE|nr:flagellar hook-basal body complex protein FliE [Helicobacteraceae bacterium]